MNLTKSIDYFFAAIVVIIHSEVSLLQPPHREMFQHSAVKPGDMSSTVDVPDVIYFI